MSRKDSRGLLDTSVLIAIEGGRPLRMEALPETTAISVVTKAELRVGIFAAEDHRDRDRRLMTFELASRIVSLPVDEAVSRALGRRCAPMCSFRQESWGQRHVDRGDGSSP